MAAAKIGRQAVVLGAGMGGLTAARAVAEHFEHVLVIERDRLPSTAVDRGGVPQGKHVHVLLAGGQRAIDALLPGFTPELARRGAVRVRVGLDLRSERPGYDPFPPRDLGWDDYWMSRALVEHTVRTLVQATPHLEIQDESVANELCVDAPGGRVCAVRWTRHDGRVTTTPSELVIDASGHARLTLDLLRAEGYTDVPETTIGVDLAYATALFAIPDDAPKDWKGVFCFPQIPESGRGALLAPVEGHRWILSVGGRGDDVPPGDPDGFMDYVRDLRRPTIHDAVKHAKRLTEIARFRFPESRHRHFDRLPRFPRGLLPLGDAICRFNPIYGQGMSVAAQEAAALHQLLGACAREADPLDGLAAAFFPATNGLIESPWSSSALVDLAYPGTRGERPADLAQRLAFGAGLAKLAAKDPAIHTLTAEVQQLLKPRAVYRDPALVSRVLAELGQKTDGT